MPPAPPFSSSPPRPAVDASTPPTERWVKGRDWDGVGPYCDAATTEETAVKMMAWGQDDSMTLSSFIQRAAEVYPDKRALTYLDGKGKETDNQSFAEVALYARRIASYLQHEVGMAVGDRAVLLYPPGPEFILAFVGCLFAGVVPVPVYPPHPYRLEVDVPRLSLIVARSGCRVALTEQSYSLVIRGIQVKSLLSKVGLAGKIDWPSLRTVCTDKVRRRYSRESLLHAVEVGSDDVAFLQYTSGSTSLPKGVMVTHRNLVAQVNLVHAMTIQAGGSGVIDMPVVSWLPQYHDMGLIGTFLACLTATAHLVYLTPITFLQDPTQWLSAMSHYRAACSPAPNFAFALVTRKTPPQLRDTLDLSCVISLICGAEPIRPEVMSAFFSHFSSTGLKPTTLTPAYGLAEFTLCATVQVAGRELSLLHVDGRVLRTEGVVKALPLPPSTPHAQPPSPQEGGVTYVSVGSGQGDTVVRIVHPHTCVAQEEGHVGEIWLDGACKALGYFADEAQSLTAFHGVIQGDDSGTQYLRTGDQGFLYQGALYVTGRIKDLIIIRGRNVYPQDVEYLVEQQLSDVLKPGCSAAFALPRQAEEAVGYAAELRRLDGPPDACDAIAARVRHVIASAFEVSVCAVVLVKPRSIPKTTSGKIQRHKCREGYLSNSLSAVFVWREDAAASEDQPPKGTVAQREQGGEEQEASMSGPISDGLSDDASFQSAESEEPDEGAMEAGPPSSPHPPLDVEVEAHVEEEDAFVSRLVAYVAEARQLPAASIDVDAPLSLLGLDSVSCVALAHTASQWVGKPVSPLVAYRHQTIRALACYLAQGAPDLEVSPLEGPPEGDLEPDLHAPVALVGSGCRIPGSQADLTCPGDLWAFLTQGGDGVSEDLPEGRRGPSRGHKDTRRPGAYLRGVDGIDAPFFGIAQEEAARLDYRQAMVLEATWHALEDAGIVPTSLAGRCVGVYVGAIGNEFATLHATVTHSTSDNASATPIHGLHTLTGGATSLLASRLSQWLHLRGPCVTIDTACSSSLVALHDALRDLRMGLCTLAIVAGVNLTLLPALSDMLSDAGLLSAHRCRPFDETADGYVRGEGVGVVVLRRLEHAFNGHDRIYALLRGAAVRHDGGGQGGVAIPSEVGQRDLLRAAYSDARVEPSQVMYVEAMGSGSPVSDGVELSALSHVLLPRPSPLLLGSGKGNWGHSEAAAGILSVIRAALILHHRLIPPTLHFHALPPHLPIPSDQLHVVTTNTPLPSFEGHGDTDGPVVGVSALGLGGSDAHVVLQAAPAAGHEPFLGDELDTHSHNADGASLPSSDPSVSPLLLPLSATCPSALRTLGLAYLHLLYPHPPSDDMNAPPPPADSLCMAASTKRAHLWPHRLAATGASPSDLADSLKTALSTLPLHEPPHTPPYTTPPCAVLLLPEATDVGDAWLSAMARGLYAHHPIFRAAVDDCDRTLADALAEPPTIAEPSAMPAWSPEWRFAALYGLGRVWCLVLADKKAVVVGEGGVGTLVAQALTGDLSLKTALHRLTQIAAEKEAQSIAPAAAVDQASEQGEQAPIANSPSGPTMPDHRPPAVAIVLGPTTHHDLQQRAAALLPRHRLLSCIPALATPTSPRPSSASPHGALHRLADAVACAYTAGISVDFATMYAASPPLAPSTLDALPRYPFQHKVYAPLADLLHASSHYSTSEALERDYGVTTLFEEHWVPRLPLPPTPPLPPPERVVWVCAQAEDAVELLCPPSSPSGFEKGGVVVVVRREQEARVRQLLMYRDGASRPTSPRLVAADIEAGEACVALMDLLHPAPTGEEDGGRTGGVGVVYVACRPQVHLQLQVREAHPSADELGPMAAAAFADAVQLLGLLRACSALAPGTQPRLWVATFGAKPVEAGEAVTGMEGALWALTRSAMQELYPTRLWATLLDLPPDMSMPALASLIKAEMAAVSRDCVPEQMAWRNGSWRLLRLRPSPLEAELSQPNLEPQPTLITGAGEEEGWVVVSGGLGGLGLHAAAALVRHGVKRLLLLGRRGVASPQYQQALQDLTQQPGVLVRVAACDVSDASSVSGLIADLGPTGVRGIVHCAGSLSDGSLGTQDSAKLHTAWRGKVIGCLNLHMATLAQPRPLDFFMIYGSSSALLGSPAESTYACANAAADALALLLRQTGIKATSLQWGTWTGLGFASQAFNAALATSGFPPIDATQGDRLMTLLLNHVASLPPLLACVPIHWQTLASHGPTYLTQGSLSCCTPLLELSSRGDTEGPTPLQPSTLTLQRWQGLDSREARLRMLESLLRDTIADVAGTQLGVEDDVIHAGVTSIQGMAVLGTLTQQLQLRIKPTKLLEHRTIASLASFVCSELERLCTHQGPQRLPLSPSQELLLSTDHSAAHRMLLHEVTVSGPMQSLPGLLSAFAALLARHPFLRTTLDLPLHCQHVHLSHTLPITPFHHHLHEAGAARDTTSIERLIHDATSSAVMCTVPPVRLLTGPRRRINGHVVVLAVSPLLADRYTLRCLSAELLALYAARLHPSPSSVSPCPALGPRQSCFLDHPPPPPPLDSKASSISTPLPTKAGLRFASLHHGVASEPWAPARQQLSSSMAQALLSTAEHANVSPASLLLAAYVAAVAEFSEGQGTVVTDVERGLGVLGPLSGPRLLPLPLPTPGPYSLSLQDVRDIDTVLRMPPSEMEPYLPTTAGLLGFTFSEDRGIDTGEDGVVAVTSSLVDSLPSPEGPTFAGPLRLTVIVPSDPAVAQWGLTLETGHSYSLAQADLDKLIHRLLCHITELTAQPFAKGRLWLSEVPVISMAEGEMKEEGGSHPLSLRRKPSTSMHTLPPPTPPTASTMPYFAVLLLQLMGLGLIGLAACLPLLLLHPLLERCLAHLHLPATLALLPLFLHGYGLLLCMQVALLRGLLPLPPPGSYPLHSLPALPCWLHARLLRLVDRCYMGHLQGTPLHHWWLRALGCRLGQDVRGLQGGAIIADPDLVTIGDGVTLGPSTRLVGSVVRDGMLHRGSVHIGAGCELGAGVVMLPDSRTQAHVTLQAGSVVQEGQSLGGGSGIYAGHPAAFLRPHSAEKKYGKRRHGMAYATIEAMLRCLVPLWLTVLAASLAYDPTTLMLESLHVFPFLPLREWPQGRVLFCLLSLLGPLPLLCLPLLLAGMTLHFRVLSCDDHMLATVAGHIGATASGTQIRRLLSTEEGLQVIRKLLPSNMQLLGAAGSEGLRLLLPGRLAVEELVLPFLMLPEARVYGLVGNLWALAVGLALAQLLTAAFATLLARLLRLMDSGRGLRVALVQWAWHTSMQPFAGTEVVCWWYRCLGARVGRGVVIGNVSPPHDLHLLAVGQDALLMDGAILDTSTHSPGGDSDPEGATGIVVGPGAVQGARAVVEKGGSLGGECIVLPLSVVLAGTQAPEGGVVEGSCIMGGSSADPSHSLTLIKPPPKPTLSGLADGLFIGLGVPLLTHVLGLLLVCVSLYPPSLALSWALTSLHSGGLGLSIPEAAACLGIIHVLFLLTLALLVAGHKWLILGRLGSNLSFEVHGATYHRRRSALAMQGLGASSGLEDLMGTLLCPLYLRLLGADIHRRAAVNSLDVGDPDVLHVGKDGVLDEGAVLCSAALEKGNLGGRRRLTLGPIRVGEGGRVGCGAVVMAGTQVGHGAMVCDASLLPPNAVVRPGGRRQGVALSQEGEEEEEGVGQGPRCVGSLEIEVYE